MAENLNKKPSKSILKNSSSFDTPDAKRPSPNKSKTAKGAKWDEMNIMATLHPPDKDYGHMKIDEPKTPYNFEGLGADPDTLDPETLAAKIREQGSQTPKALQSNTSESEDDETAEERAARKEFEMKRKKHYNEYYAVKLARKLLEKDEDEEEEEDEGKEENDEKDKTHKSPDKTGLRCQGRRLQIADDSALGAASASPDAACTLEDEAKPTKGKKTSSCFRSCKCTCTETLRKM